MKVRLIEIEWQEWSQAEQTAALLVALMKFIQCSTFQRLKLWVKSITEQETI